MAQQQQKGIVPFKEGTALPKWLIATDDEAGDNTEFSHGAGEGFGVISFKGKVWRVKYKGEEHKLTRTDQNTGEVNLVTKLRCVLLKGNPHYSKIFYAKKYSDGDDSAPDCMSADGVKPDASVERPQHTECATCPNNMWGSRMTEDGRKAKSCTDARRVAVLLVDPTLDITVDEPVLLRIPPDSLKELKTYADGMAKMGVPLWKIVTSIGFDADKAHPCLTFGAVGWDESRLQEWKELRESDIVERILGTNAEHAMAAPSNGSRVRAASVDASGDGEEDDETPEPTPAPTPAPTRAKTSKAAPEPTPSSKPKKGAAKAAPAPTPEPTQEAGDEVEEVSDSDTDALVARMLGEI